MAFEDVVKIINRNCRADRDDAIRHRDSPRIIKIMDHLILLTDDEETQAEALKNAKPACTHEIIGNNGVCKNPECGKQVFALKA